jgi:hypothetical protein
MAPQKEPKPNDWDRRPWPEQGDSDPKEIFAAVGEALSSWENLEGLIATLFAAFVTTDENIAPAKRAYVAARTFEGRKEMLKAASEAFFSSLFKRDVSSEETAAYNELKDGDKKFLTKISSFSPRRNEITHGILDIFYKRLSDDQFQAVPGTVALYPTAASFQNRNLEGIPSYCMTSREIIYFSDKFRGLLTSAHGLTYRALATRLDGPTFEKARKPERE